MAFPFPAPKAAAPAFPAPAFPAPASSTPAAPAFPAPAAKAPGGFPAPAFPAPASAPGFPAPAKAPGFPAPGFPAPGGATTAAPAATPGDPNVLGPGYIAPNAQNVWTTGIDPATHMRDDAPFEQLPQSLQTHLKEMNAFIRSERKADAELKKIYSGLLQPSNDAGFAALRKKMEEIQDGTNAMPALKHRGTVQLDNIKLLTADLKAASDIVAKYRSSPAWERLSSSGAEFWAHGHNSMEGPSDFFEDTTQGLAERMAQIELQLRQVQSVLRPYDDSATGGGGAVGGGDPYSSIVIAMDAELAALMEVGARAASLHQAVDHHREQFARQHGDAEAQELFGSHRRQGDPQKDGASKRMGFDPHIYAAAQQKQQATTTTTTNTTTTTTGGGGAAAPTATTAPNASGGGAAAPAFAFPAPGGAAPATATNATENKPPAAPAFSTPSPAPAFQFGSPSPIAPSTGGDATEAGGKRSRQN